MIGVYLIGAVIALLFTLMQYHHVADRLRQSCRMPSDKERARFAVICENNKVRRSPVFLICEEESFESPVTFGVLRKTVVIPSAVSDATLPFMLGHELTHCKRNDTLSKLVLALLGSAYWFHPLIHVFIRAMNELCEQACDERFLRGSTADERQAYCRLLVLTAREQGEKHRLLFTTFKGGTSEMKRRISNVLTEKKRAGSVLLIVLLVLALTLSACTYLKEPAVSGEETTPSETTDPAITTEPPETTETTSPNAAEPTQTTTTAPPETTTEPYVEPEPVKHFVSPTDEIRTSKVFTVSDTQNVTMTLTVYGYASKSLGMDFYVKSNEFTVCDFVITNQNKDIFYQIKADESLPNAYIFDMTTQDDAKRISFLYGDVDLRHFRILEEWEAGSKLHVLETDKSLQYDGSIFLGDFSLTNEGYYQYTPCREEIYDENYTSHFSGTVTLPYWLASTYYDLIYDLKSESPGLPSGRDEYVLSMEIRFDVVYIPFEAPVNVQSSLYTQTVYDQQNRVSKEITKELHVGYGTEIEYQYREDGYTKTETQRDKLNNVILRTESYYDANGILFEAHEIDGTGAVAVYTVESSTEIFTSSKSQKTTEFKKVSRYRDGLLMDATLYDEAGNVVIKRNFTYQTIEYEGKSYIINTSITATDLRSLVTLTANKEYPAYKLHTIRITDPRKRRTGDTTRDFVWYNGYPREYPIYQYENNTEMGYAVRRSAADGSATFKWYELRLYDDDFICFAYDDQGKRTSIYSTIYKWTAPGSNSDKPLHPQTQTMQDEIAMYFGEDLYIDYLEIPS